MKLKISIKNWQWYLEYHTGIRLTFYVSVMINNYPIFVVCKFDDPHSTVYWKHYVVQLLFFKWEINVNEPILP